MSDQIAQLADAIVKALGRLQTKTISGTPTAQLLQGPGGLFTAMGLDNTIINASLNPRGIDAVIPAFATQDMNPVFGFITGFDPDGSAEPSGVCEDCPGGVMEVCHQTAQFGRVCRESAEMEINELVQKVNRGQTTDLMVLGDVLGDDSLRPRGMSVQEWTKYVTRAQMVIIGHEFQQALLPMIWQGNPANNTAGGGYKEFPGLDIMISTPKRDIYTNTRCEAIEPDVKDFNYGDVCGTTPDIVEYISYLEMYLRHNADRMGLAPVQWVMAMRPELWMELTACWPCKYLTNRCNGGLQQDGAVVINDSNNVDMRDAMRNGNFLWVNGRQMPVITDDGIYEANSANDANLAAGEFASDIYIVPLTAAGRRVTYFEYLDYSKAAVDIASMNGTADFWVSDGGRYMWNTEQRSWCFKIRGKIEPRLILRTPQLAGRLQNVKYTPLQHLRSPFADSPYRLKGGVESVAHIDANWYKDYEGR